MLSTQQITDYCLTKPGSYTNMPFGPDVLCARIGKRIFAEISMVQPWITLKCDPIYGEMTRSQYPGTVRRGYHCPPPQHPYNNTITLDGTVPDAVLLEMIDHSYARALASLTKREQAEAVLYQREDT